MMNLFNPVKSEKHLKLKSSKRVIFEDRIQPPHLFSCARIHFHQLLLEEEIDKVAKGKETRASRYDYDFAWLYLAQF